MATCDTCGNDYDKPLTISGGWMRVQDSQTFDSFECAIQALAPSCAHCGCRVLGHGVENGDAMFCCAHCAREFGETQLMDRV